MMLNKQQTLLALSAVALSAACKPSIGQPPYLITETTLLAVRGEPPEAKPGASVTYSFLLASPTGPIANAGAIWNVCSTPKPPAESNAVSSACAEAPDAGAGSVGETFAAVVPIKACQLFGPIAPPPMPGRPPVRPRDADSTGGYYLPVQVWLPNLSADALSGFALERITCNLANAPSAAIKEYNANYQPNNDPGIDRTDLVDSAGNVLSLDVGSPAVRVGEVATIQATFAAGSPEFFPVYDPQSETLKKQQETLHLSWFVTGGTFAHDRTGVAAGETVTSTSNRWTAPDHAGTVYVWLVLRDSRGGTAFKSYQIEVRP